jgi:hypothetical protein
LKLRFPYFRRPQKQGRSFRIAPLYKASNCIWVVYPPNALIGKHIVKSQVARFYASLIADTIWLSDQDPLELNAIGRPQLLRAALALDLLEPSRVDGDAQ